MLNCAVGEKSGDAARVDGAIDEAGSDQGADFAGEGEAAGECGDVERLDAHGVSGQDESLAFGVEEREGEHSLETVNGFFGAPKGQSVKKDFGVAVAAEVDALT